MKLWDSWGIPMKYKGKWEFAGHAFPGQPLTHLKYAGGNQKQVLTRQAVKNGAHIINRVTIFDLLTEGDRVTGALGLDTWNNKIIEFQTKAIFLGTGGCLRLYPASTPGWMFNAPMSPFNTGDGRAMVYRAGGALRDMEFLGQWAGAKYYARSGKATWIGVLRKPDDSPVGPFVNKPDRIYGDVTSDCWPTVFNDYMHTGRGPVYMDCRGASREDIDYMKYWLENEGNKGMLEEMATEGIDPLTHAVEFCTYGIGVSGGVDFNTEGKTSLKGLFAAGQEYSGDMAFATTLGWTAGENLAKFAKEAEYGDIGAKDNRKEGKLDLVENILARNSGAGWQEANIALQQIMLDYAGLVRSETLLDQGLKNIDRLRKRVKDTLFARNGHELGRCLEVLNLLDIGQAVMLCARERRETRARHNRTDYPFTNPLMNKYLTIRKEDGQVIFDWKKR